MKDTRVKILAVRFKFYIANKGMLAGEEGAYELALPDGRSATLRAINSDTLGKSTAIEVVAGGFATEEEARRFGVNIKNAVLFFGVKFNMGVDVGDDKETGKWTQAAKDAVFEKTGIELMSDIHGVSIYAEGRPVVFSSMSAYAVSDPKSVEFFEKEIADFLSIQNGANLEPRLAMELVNASFFESTARARFLTLVLAAESILDPEDRPEAVTRLVDGFKEQAAIANIPDDEKESICGTLTWLYKDSISKSLKKTALKYLPGKVYDGVPSHKFIARCYEVRSKLVHKGAIDKSQYNIESLAASLTKYLTDMLIAMTSA